MPELTAAAIAERVGWIEDLGFSNADAAMLATARDSAGILVTVHELRAALKGGCSHAMAMQVYA